MTIDWWTLGLQTINVAILVWLLKRFFWRIEIFEDLLCQCAIQTRAWVISQAQTERFERKKQIAKKN